MTAWNWSPLRNALEMCRHAGVSPSVWWRDDDATTETAALDRLATLAEDVRISVHLAVIPRDATPSLARYCVSAPLLPVVHGWAHADHSPPDHKKDEFRTVRDSALSETAHAMSRMKTLFGSSLRPMFVPPWNRIGAPVIAGLAAQGYRVLSTFGPRSTPDAAPGLRQINTHVDPIWWKGTRDLVDPDILIEQAAAQLAARATGHADASEPFGLLTHHLVHTSAIWTFARDFLTEMQMGGAMPWQLENDDEQT